MAAHRYWRLYVTNCGGSLPGLAALELRAVVGGPDISNAAGGFASSEYSPAYAAANAFDHSNITEWSANALAPGWIGNDLGLGSDSDVAEVLIRARSTWWEVSAPRDFKIQYSDNGVDWFDHWTVLGEIGWSASEERLYTGSYTDPKPVVTQVVTDYITRGSFAPRVTQVVVDYIARMTGCIQDIVAPVVTAQYVALSREIHVNGGAYHSTFPHLHTEWTLRLDGVEQEHIVEGPTTTHIFSGYDHGEVEIDVCYSSLCDSECTTVQLTIVPCVKDMIKPEIMKVDVNCATLEATVIASPYVSSSAHLNTRWRIFDTAGEQILETLVAAETRHEFTDLDPGVYFLQVCYINACDEKCSDRFRFCIPCPCSQLSDFSELRLGPLATLEDHKKALVDFETKFNQLVKALRGS